MKLQLSRWALALIAIFLIGGCASTGENSGVADVQVEVVNDLIPPTSLSIWVVPSIGGRDMLGSVPPGATRTLGYNMVTASGEYRLQGETTAGDEIWSNPFILSESDATVVWDLSANSIVVE